MRCHSRTTQTIRWASTTTPLTTTRSPLPGWQPCLRTLAQGARSAILPNKPQLHREVPFTGGTAHRSLNQWCGQTRPRPRTRRRRWRSHLAVGRPHPQARRVVEVHAPVKSVCEGAQRYCGNSSSKQQKLLHISRNLRLLCGSATQQILEKTAGRGAVCFGEWFCPLWNTASGTVQCSAV